MTVTLNAPYAGYATGTSRQLRTSVEASLIAQGLASSVAETTITTGAVTTSEVQGRVAVPIGSSSVVVTNPNVTAQSKVWAVVAQAAADATLLRVERVVCAAGSFTIFGTANATAATLIDWAIMLPSGSTQTN